MKKAFTLIEMVIVIVLLGILAAIIVPSQTSYVSAAKGTQAVAVHKNFKTTFQAYRNLSESSATQIINNDYDYDGTDGTETVRVTFNTTGISALTDNDTPTAIGTIGTNDAGGVTACIALLEVFGNISNSNVTSDWSVTTGANQCTFTHSSSTKAFTYTNTGGGTVSDLQ